MRTPRLTLFPYTTLFRSEEFKQADGLIGSGRTDEAISAFERLRQEYPATWIDRQSQERLARLKTRDPAEERRPDLTNRAKRSEEHTSELQSHSDLVCRLL